MGAIMKLSINNRGIGELLRSDGVQANIHARAEKVGAAARARSDMEILVEDRRGARARTRVIALDPRAKRLEAKYRVLGSSLDAGRG